ncbi:S-adenosyl-L-methionine-dependent methyltransferase [Glonium stellatum]|uniref:S-adenosyl-L-methionine-dependent methyltransferase n=1 Tax=Glonium stellatum TaxID=574774 RepID=A0A8E2JZ40_9PEZI|nr:S-adenosyl-L-methionine-dependent methyltransferase [Glonium stellatum]
MANDGSQNPSVHTYYCNLESRIGYWLFLGNTRHCGLYEKGRIWPFPISKAQRRTEEKLFNRLGLEPGSEVLDAGIGSEYVAMYMAEKGLYVDGVDIIPSHVEDAKRNIKAHGLEDKISIRLGDYQNLIDFPDGSFDGIYTMETFVHADDPVKAIQGFYRLLRPGGALVHHEADIHSESEVIQDVLRLSHCLNVLEEGTLRQTLEDVGFKDVNLEDLTAEGIIGYVPYRILQFFGLQDRFTNIMASVETYLNRETGRYISVKAVKY